MENKNIKEKILDNEEKNIDSLKLEKSRQPIPVIINISMDHYKNYENNYKILHYQIFKIHKVLTGSSQSIIFIGRLKNLNEID